MGDWTKVVTNPLGLVGFVLFLVFGYLAKVKRNDERRWFSPVALVLAFVALGGGLFIAYEQIPKAPPVTNTMQARPPANQQSSGNVQQSSSGADSPNVQGVQGNVTITMDQSKGATQTTAPSATKTQENK